jgi:cobalt-zinc-cadmium efflux system protein
MLMRGGGHQHNLNTRGAFLHVIGDMFGSIGAIAAALLMLATGWYLADPILSAGIGGLILWSSWRLLRESVEVLLETAPRHLDVTEVCDALRGVAGVADVHDIHVWTVTSGLVAMSGHVEVSGVRPWSEVLPDLTEILQKRFAIAHATLQPEASDSRPGAFRGCSFALPDGHAACRVPATADRQAGAHAGHQH